MPGVADATRAAAVLAVAVAAYAPLIPPLERSLLFAASAGAAWAAWQAPMSAPWLVGAAAMALGAQAVILLGQCAEPAATAATALAACWTLGASLALSGRALLPASPRQALDLLAAGLSTATVSAVLALADADLGGAIVGAVAAATALVAADPLTRAHAGIVAIAQHAAPGRQSPAGIAVWWMALAVLSTALGRAAWRTWGGA